MNNITDKKFNSDSKKIIRSDWIKPILKDLHENLGKKLFYLGLPDSEAIDIKEWLEYLDSVYAFQCREYPNASDSNQSREKIVILEKTLRELERKRHISTFDVFDGYIEEVILRGFDNSPNRKEYLQEKTITLYNLDFCNQITSPIKYLDKYGTLQEAFKLNAISRLLYYQKNIIHENKKFIMFLTLHCSYSGKEIHEFYSKKNPDDIDDIREYIKQIEKLTKGNKSPYIIKAFIYYTINKFFTDNLFYVEFLPTIYYKGDNENPLLFFTIIGTTEADNTKTSIVQYQKMSEILNTPFLSPMSNNKFEKNEKLNLKNDIEFKEDLNNLNSLSLLKSLKIYQKLCEND